MVVFVFRDAVLICCFVGATPSYGVFVIRGGWVGFLYVALGIRRCLSVFSCWPFTDFVREEGLRLILCLLGFYIEWVFSVRPIFVVLFRGVFGISP